jgi:hypothetical protein
MESTSLRDEAIRLVEGLPANFTWDDLMHEIYVRQAIEAGLEASRNGRIVPLEEARARLEQNRS